MYSLIITFINILKHLICSNKSKKMPNMCYNTFNIQKSGKEQGLISVKHNMLAEFLTSVLCMFYVMNNNSN